MAFADSLRIGSVGFVSPDKFEVLLDSEAPESIALNTGSAQGFPRVNGYLLVPTEGGFAVGQVEWITVEGSQYGQRKDLRDPGLVDVPFPVRKMSLSPLGVLFAQGSSADGSTCFSFRRGIQTFPTVGDPVLLPTNVQLRSIVESGSNRRVRIGTSPLAADADVMIDPDRLFGRHLAVLGNTGSGKSCSVAGLIRWSVEASRSERKQDGVEQIEPNARFVILDPNGEYTRTFKDLGVKVLAVEADDHAVQLKVPLWSWNSEEWAAFTQAAPKTQRPTLIQALRSLRDGQLTEAASSSAAMRRYLRTIVNLMKLAISTGDPWASGGKSKGFKERVVDWNAGFTNSSDFTDVERDALQELSTAVEKFLASSTSDNPLWPRYQKPSVDELANAVSQAFHSFGGSETSIGPVDADLPLPFSADDLIRSVEANAELLGFSEYVETMLVRIRTLLGDSRLRAVFGETTDESLSDWLDTYLGGAAADSTPVTVVDLSLLPAEVVHIVTAVIARLMLEALQRYRKLNDGQTLPTVLVMEEAHNFIMRRSSDSDSKSAQEVCAQAFERIAREGRKYGLGLVLSSQRPSELSPTVLSQCNTFLLHRLSNHTDQDLVFRLVPDNLRGLLRDLPSLPSRSAILLGWATELPVAVEMLELPAARRPQSNDPAFWHVWSGTDDGGSPAARPVDWDAVAADWQHIPDQVDAPVKARGNGVALND